MSFVQDGRRFNRKNTKGEFATGTDFQVWSNVSLENCTVNGVLVTADNVTTLFPDLNMEKVTLK